MRSPVVLLVTAVTALALGTSVATAAGAQPFHGELSCQPISADRTVCFEAWGVFKPQESGGTVSVAQRRFTEYTAGVLTFEQRDHSLHVVKLDASGAEQVRVDLFSGWSTPSGLVCRFRDHIVVVDGTAVHSVDLLSCSDA